MLNKSMDYFSGIWGVVHFDIFVSVFIEEVLHCIIFRDYFVRAPSQWQTMLLRNIISHWLGTYTKWSRIFLYVI